MRKKPWKQELNGNFYTFYAHRQSKLFALIKISRFSLSLFVFGALFLLIGEWAFDMCIYESEHLLRKKWKRETRARINSLHVPEIICKFGQKTRRAYEWNIKKEVHICSDRGEREWASSRSLNQYYSTILQYGFHIEWVSRRYMY